MDDERMMQLQSWDKNYYCGAFPRGKEDKVRWISSTEKLILDRAGMGKSHVGGSWQTGTSAEKTEAK